MLKGEWKMLSKKDAERGMTNEKGGVKKLKRINVRFLPERSNTHRNRSLQKGGTSLESDLLRYFIVDMGHHDPFAG